MRDRRQKSLDFLGVDAAQFKEDLADFDGEVDDLAEYYLRPTAKAFHAAAEDIESCNYLLGEEQRHP